MQHVVLVGDRTRRIKRAKPLSGRLLQLTWSDDVVETKDVAPILANHRAFVRLRTDDELFATLKATANGEGIGWAGGLTISASLLDKLPQTLMSAEELRTIMTELSFSSDGLASMLGLSRRAITDYRGGAVIPKAVVLAVRYLREVAHS